LRLGVVVICGVRCHVGTGRWLFALSESNQRGIASLVAGHRHTVAPAAGVLPRVRPRSSLIFGGLFPDVGKSGTVPPAVSHLGSRAGSVVICTGEFSTKA